MRGYSDEEIFAAVRTTEGFKGFPGTPEKPEFADVWIRAKGANLLDMFRCKVFTYKCFGEGITPEFQMKCTGTSVPGKFGLLYFAQWNSKGCAVLKSNVFVYGSHVPGLHKKKQAYIQAYDERFVGFPYTRDNDKDLEAEEFGTVYTDRIGANCHRAGWFSQVVWNWSVGCLVRNKESEFLAWLKLLNGRRLSTVILKEF